MTSRTHTEAILRTVCALLREAGLAMRAEANNNGDVCRQVGFDYCSGAASAWLSAASNIEATYLTRGQRATRRLKLVVNNIEKESPGAAPTVPGPC